MVYTVYKKLQSGRLCFCTLNMSEGSLITVIRIKKNWWKLPESGRGDEEKKEFKVGFQFQILI